MAWNIKLANPNTTINFFDVSSDYVLKDEGLDIGPINKEEFWDEDPNGRRLIDIRYINREITLRFDIKGASREAITTNIQTIQNFFTEALLYDRDRLVITGYGGRSELQVQWDGATDSSYFEVRTGTFFLPNNVQSVAQILQTDKDGDYIIRDCLIQLMCDPFAYPISPATGTPALVSISNGNGSGTGGVQVDNTDDADEDNWVSITGSNVAGDHPSTTVLEIRKDASSPDTKRIYVGHRLRTAADDQFTFEAENYGSSTGGWTNQVNAAASGGQFERNTVGTIWNGGDVSLVGDGLVWNMTNTTNWKGPFRAFAVHYGAVWPQNLVAQVSVADPSPGSSFFGGPVVHSPTSSAIWDLGTFEIPTHHHHLSGLANQNVRLYFQLAESGSSQQIDLDYLFFMPQDGGYRIYEFRDDGLYDNTRALYDDNWERAVYRDQHTSGTVKTPDVIAHMRPIKLVPGVTQKLYFLFEDTAGLADRTNTHTIFLRSVPNYGIVA